ncbi:hypothetical protein [Pararhizobium sp. IMCC21322]|uniref:hypothetical protein n=1 Tax=Pararhizobium sp. IMCC21322 TaxID=3067903 RepID=UPI0027410AC8|nr:hypothetical protein [Pararhizobium sp. IMCC21322]
MKPKENGSGLVRKAPQKPNPNLHYPSHFSGNYLAEIIGLSDQITIWNVVASRKKKQQD